MTPERLSQLTWTVEDRRAWDEAYQHARRIDRARRRRERAASDRRYSVEGRNLSDAWSVRADLLRERGLS